MYHAVLTGLTAVLKKNLPILYSNDNMVEVFKNPLMAAFKRPRNLRNMVVRTS